MIDPGLDGHVALVTGANHGIGAAIVAALERQGARVGATFFRPTAPYTPDQLDAAARAGVGGDALYRARQQQATAGWEMDLGDPENIPRLFDRCEDALGPVEILIVNHTHCVEATFDPAQASDTVRPIDAGEIDRHFAVNARAFALLVDQYVRRRLARGGTGGRVIAISTDAAHAHPANIHYAASKHALESYVRSAAAELGRYQITVNAVAPGPVQTGYIPPEFEAELAAGTPLGRVGQPDDIADAVVFLASHQARWITGQLLYVGGGWRMGQ